MQDRDTDSITVDECQQHLRKHLDRMKQTGRPLVVTHAGQRQAVLIDPALFEAVRDEIQSAQDEAMIRKGIEQMRRGEGRPMREVIQEMIDKLKRGSSGDAISRHDRAGRQ